MLMGNKGSDRKETTSIRLNADIKESLDQLPQPNSKFIREAVEEKLQGVPSNISELKSRKKFLENQKKKVKQEYEDKIQELNAKIDSVEKKIKEEKKIQGKEKQRRKEEKKELKKSLKNTYELYEKNSYVPKKTFEFDLNKSSNSNKLNKERWARILSEVHKDETGEELNEIPVKSRNNYSDGSFTVKVPD